VEEILAWQKLVRSVRISDELKHYIVRLVSETRQLNEVQLAASPRASLALMKVAQAMSLMKGEEFVTPESIQEVACDVIGHRVVLHSEAKFSGASGRGVVENLLERVKVPV